MRDGVELGADLYQPSSETLGTLLTRGPYGRGWASSLMAARTYAARGYRVVFVSSRGTVDSAGQLEPMRDEAADGQDVVAWMRRQPWFTGTFGTVGVSYLGIHPAGVAVRPTPDLAAAVITVGPARLRPASLGTGAFNLDFLQWSGLGRARVARCRSWGRSARKALDGLPLADAGEAYLGGRAPWYRDRVTRPDLTDPYWTPMCHDAALDRVNVLVLLIEGWHDLNPRNGIRAKTRTAHHPP